MLERDMDHEIEIVSGYNGRLHRATIRRAEALIGIVVDGKTVYFDKQSASAYGVTQQDKPQRRRSNVAPHDRRDSDVSCRRLVGHSGGQE